MKHLKELIILVFVTTSFYFLGHLIITYREKCCTKPNEAQHYLNIDLRIRAFYQTTVMRYKNRTTTANAILLETLTIPKMYVQITDHDHSPHIHIGSLWLKIHSVGDTVHFDFIGKYRFFEVKK